MGQIDLFKNIMFPSFIYLFLFIYSSITFFFYCPDLETEFRCSRISGIFDLNA